MTTPKSQLLAAVPDLDDPREPFTYAVEGDRIVGRWDIVRATSLYPTAIEHLDKDYSITVELDEERGSYDFEERTTTTTARADGDGLRARKDFFKGKTTSKEFGLTFGGVNKTDEGISVAPVAYSFETGRIKEPLFGFLEEHGWEKKGLLGRLFGR